IRRRFPPLLLQGRGAVLPAAPPPVRPLAPRQHPQHLVDAGHLDRIVRRQRLPLEEALRAFEPRKLLHLPAALQRFRPAKGEARPMRAMAISRRRGQPDRRGGERHVTRRRQRGEEALLEPARPAPGPGPPLLNPEPRLRLARHLPAPAVEPRILLAL